MKSRGDKNKHELSRQDIAREIREIEIKRQRKTYKRKRESERERNRVRNKIKKQMVRRERV